MSSETQNPATKTISGIIIINSYKSVQHTTQERLVSSTSRFKDGCASTDNARGGFGNGQYVRPARAPHAYGAKTYISCCNMPKNRSGCKKTSLLQDCGSTQWRIQDWRLLVHSGCLPTRRGGGGGHGPSRPPLNPPVVAKVCLHGDDDNFVCEINRATGQRY